MKDDKTVTSRTVTGSWHWFDPQKKAFADVRRSLHIEREDRGWYVHRNDAAPGHERSTPLTIENQTFFDSPEAAALAAEKFVIKTDGVVALEEEAVKA